MSLLSTRMEPSSLFMLGHLYQSIGGMFCIDPSGRRFKLRRELNQSTDMVRVCVMLEGLLDNLCDDDKTLLFDWFAEIAIDPENITATFAEPTRRAA